MSFFQTEARISKDPIVGLIKLAGADSSPDKLVAVAGVANGDDGKLIVPSVVQEAAKEVLNGGLNLSYSPSSGINELGVMLTQEILGYDTITALSEMGLTCSAVVTTGGTNAISSTLVACTNEDDDIITHSPHWPGFDSVALSINRKPLTCFDMLNKEGKFNINGFEKCILDTLAKNKKQSKIAIIINTPYDNPTGQDFGNEAWDQIANVLAQFEDKEILLILDTAYIDFGPKGKDYRRLKFLIDFFNKVTSPNFNLVIAGSVSKSFAMYGSRVGVATLISRNGDNTDKWSNVVGGVIRGTYSNSARHGQEIALNILSDMKKLAGIHDFQEKTSDLIAKRNKHFIDEMIKGSEMSADTKSHKLVQITKKLQLLKPDGGFFTALKISDANFAAELQDRFLTDKTYLPVICGQYIRVPTCSLKEELLTKLAGKIIKTAQELESK